MVDQKNKQSQKSLEYQQFVSKITPKTSLVHSLLFAFLFGGAICALGQLCGDLLMLIPNMTEENAKLWALIFLIAIAIVLSGLGVFDDIARFGGAGMFLPITGFANAVASAAIEFRSEGIILGMGAKMFVVAGPVVVNSVVWSVVAGLIHLVIARAGG